MTNRDKRIAKAIIAAEKQYPCIHQKENVILVGCLSCELINREGLLAAALYDIEILNRKLKNDSSKK